jgi:phosphate transport system substrate-binding protein
MAKKIFISMLFSAACLMQSTIAEARDQVRIVGSSTVFPFVAAAAETYSEKAGVKAPIAESIGTGAGLLEFCKGVGEKYPDIATASRQIVKPELEICKKNNVGELLELSIGLDGIVVATSIEAEPFDLTRAQLFLALAKNIIKDDKIIENPYKKWSDIDSSLPNYEIEVYGPSSTSGTRDAFVELVFEPVCLNIPEVIKQFSDAKSRKAFCHGIREDGAYIEAGENDNLIVQKLGLNKNSLGIFGYSYMEQNIDKIQPINIDGIAPEFENIADGTYPVARSLYLYVKLSHVKLVKDLKGFLQEITSDGAISEEGYLVDMGLIPLPKVRRDELQRILMAKIK